MLVLSAFVYTRSLCFVRDTFDSNQHNAFRIGRGCKFSPIGSIRYSASAMVDFELESSNLAASKLKPHLDWPKRLHRQHPDSSGLQRLHGVSNRLVVKINAMLCSLPIVFGIRLSPAQPCEVLSAASTLERVVQPQVSKPVRGRCLTKKTPKSCLETPRQGSTQPYNKSLTSATQKSQTTTHSQVSLSRQEDGPRPL